MKRCAECGKRLVGFPKQRKLCSWACATAWKTFAPKHLFLGTHQDNMIDMHLKGRRRADRFTADQIRELRKILANYKFGMGKELARKYGVSGPVISKIKRGEAYRYVQ